MIEPVEGGAARPVGEALSIGLFGYFNPQIFHPTWFASVALLTDEDTKSFEVQADSPDLVAFETARFAVEVSTERFLATASDSADFEDLRELVEDVFRVLEHTPITAVGISRESYVPFPDGPSVERFVDTFVPRQPWERLLGEHAQRRLTVVSSAEDPRYRRRVILQPSDEVENAVYIDVIDEVDVQEDRDHVSGAAEGLAALDTLWPLSVDHVTTVRAALLDGVMQS